MIQSYSIDAPVLQVQNVSLKFGDNQILRDVNITVHDVKRPPPILQGQVISFLGPSGRGKTQLSKILAGLQPPTTGIVLVNNPPKEVKAGMVGYVTQNYLLRRNRTLIGNLKLAAHMRGLRGSALMDMVMQYVKFFELELFIDHYPAQLSGGQRQRVAIAQQLLCSEHYIIMDEPFSGLDPLMKEKVCELIIEVSLMDELNTLIIISHDIRASLQVADTVWLLGQDRDEQDQLIPGSYIKFTYDLMSMGMCWDPTLSKTPEFNDLVLKINSDFKNL